MYVSATRQIDSWLCVLEIGYMAIASNHAASRLVLLAYLWFMDIHEMYVILAKVDELVNGCIEYYLLST